MVKDRGDHNRPENSARPGRSDKEDGERYDYDADDDDDDA